MKICTLTFAALLLNINTASAQAQADDGNQSIYASLPPLDLPPVDADTLAFGSALELVSGSFELIGSGVANNGVDDESAVWNLSLGTRYFRSLEKTTLGYSIEMLASESLARVPFDGGSQFTNALVIDAFPESRFYPTAGSPLFVHLTGVFDVVLSSVAFAGTVNDFESDSIAPGNVGAVAGLGFGRVLAIDPIVRLRRLELALMEEGLLGAPIGADVGTNIIRDWYALRNDIGNYGHLAYTMKELNGAGALRGQPDLRATFKALQVLDDPFIFNRRRGWEGRAGIGVIQPFIGYDDQPEPDASLGFLASGQYEQPLSTTRQVSLIGKAFVDLGGTADTDPPRNWNLRGFATYTEVFYTPMYVPTGALTVTAEAGISDVRQNEIFPDVETGIDAVGAATYTRVLNRGSLASGTARMTARNDGAFTISISLGISWGVASGFFTPYTGAAALQ